MPCLTQIYAKGVFGFLFKSMKQTPSHLSETLRSSAQLTRSDSNRIEFTSSIDLTIAIYTSRAYAEQESFFGLICNKYEKNL
ncbi:hypothetical protein Fmac_024557 [Flemingia macrophylla]|uniref:Uncharacterized protein n=1 Tax=Flemingia macrophylla TaxID=520843 RepID=A0ABD1LPQ5_9FABA